MLTRRNQRALSAHFLLECDTPQFCCTGKHWQKSAKVSAIFQKIALKLPFTASQQKARRDGRSPLFCSRVFLVTKKFVSALLPAAMLLPLWPASVAFAAGTPSVVSYQGRLADASGNLLGGTGTTFYFKFSIWDNATVGAGSRLWPIAAPGTTTAVVREGVFNVNIGDTGSGYPDVLDYDFSTNANIYLQVEVSSDNVLSQTLTPRLRIASNAFAQLAGAVSGSTTPSSFGTTSPLARSVVTIEATSSQSIPLSLRARATQAANLFQIQDALGSALFLVNGSGGGPGSTLNAANCDLKADTSGNFLCGTDDGGTGSEVNWTFFNNSGVRISTTTNQVLIGATATTSLSKLEVSGDVRADFFTSTTTSVNVFPQLAFTNATGTSLTLTGSSTIQFLRATDGAITTLNVTQGIITTGTIGQLSFTNATGTSLVTTGSSTIQELNSTNATIGSLTLTDPFTVSQLSFTNATGTSLVTTGSSTIQTLRSTDGSISSLTSNTGSIGQMSFKNATGTSLYASASSTFQTLNIGVLTNTVSSSLASTTLTGLTLLTGNTTTTAGFHLGGGATTTAANGVSLSNGCFALSGSCLSAASFGASTFQYPFVSALYGLSTSTTIGFLSGLVANASSTISDLKTTTLTFSGLSNSGLGVNNVGVVYSAPTTTFSGGITYLNEIGR